MAYLNTLPASQARTNFETCLVEFYALILQFLADAVRIYRKGSITRAFDAFWRIEDVSTFENACNKMASRAETEASNCERDLNATNRAVVKRQQDDLRQVLKQLEAMHLIRTGIDKLEAKFDLSKLPVATGAAFNSHQSEHDARCHPDTRVDLLREIYDWADDIDGKCIFWLRGKAGTGKSTISRTVAQAFADQGRLGASFFFKRGEHDRENASLFFTTIAVDLVRQIPELATPIHQAIDEDPGIARKVLREQFEKLIYQPLAYIGPTSSARPILVIDALDECDREGDIRTILSLLASIRRLGSAHVQVFLTSRPELPINLGFAQIGTETHRDVALHDIPSSTIRHDISVYLESEFRRIREEHNCLWPMDQALAPHWPGRQTLESFIELSVPLFIVAATITRFIGDRRGDPHDRLATFLAQLNTGQMTQMGQTYLPALCQILVDVEEPEEKDKLCRDFREIVGSIILLANPLSTISLSRLLQIPRRKIDHQLRLLHSVLSVPSNPDAPVTLFHLSFREFLVKTNNSDRARLFAIDEFFAHANLSDKCLALLQSPSGLRKDICQLQHPGVLREDIDETTVNEHIPPYLQYACRYWVYHLQHSGRKIRDDDIVATFLRQRFLHWLESLSLMGKVSESVNFVTTLQSLVAEKNSQISAFLEDARRFVLAFNPILAQAPLQAYAGAWHFSPLKSIVRNNFQDQALQSVRVIREIPERWSACLLTCEGHSSAINSVVFSPDGSRVASGSYDSTVRVWDVQMGVCEQTLKGHSYAVNSVAISPDGSRVASSASDSTVQVWDVQTGVCEQTLEGHSDKVHSVVLSPDGSRVVSGSNDSTVRVWDVQTGACEQTLEGHSRAVNSVVFSPDGSRVASGSDDSTVRVWDVQTGACEQTLEGHSHAVNSVVFSPDGSRVASGSYDSTVRVWDVQTGACEQTLEGHSDSVDSVVFSPDGSRVASGSDDSTVRVWDVTTGAELLCYDSETYDNHIEFVDNGSNILANGQVINIPQQLPRPTVTMQSPSFNLPSGGKLGVDGDWITWSSQRIFWLPSEYRPTSHGWVGHSDIIIIGSGNGRVTFVRRTV
jgi:WD40 repeat protein/Mrp family chromosome partitioning ATPase